MDYESFIIPELEMTNIDLCRDSSEPCQHYKYTRILKESIAQLLFMSAKNSLIYLNKSIREQIKLNQAKHAFLCKFINAYELWT